MVGTLGTKHDGCAILLNMELNEVFEKHVVRQDGCWSWIGSTDKGGYGVMKSNGKQYRAPRVSFYLHYGHWPIPVCRHTCDNPICTNPSHLLEGTVKQNTHDAIRRGRFKGFPKLPKGGENNGRAVLTEEQVQEIREAYARGGVRQVDLAEKYGVGQGAISKLLLGKSWT